MLKQICKNLVHRKTRTLLTTAGITVGVAMIVTLGAMGEGLRTGYASVFSGSGADLVMMQKGSYDIVASAVDQGIVAQVAALPEVAARLRNKTTARSVFMTVVCLRVCVTE